MYSRAFALLYFSSSLLMLDSTFAIEDGYVWQDLGDDRVELFWNGKLAVSHLFPELDETSIKHRLTTCKPYHHIFCPDQRASRLTKELGGKLPHRAGIFYGFSNISYGDGKTCDIWNCKDKAYQKGNGNKWSIGPDSQDDVDGVEDDHPYDHVSHCVDVSWHGQDGELFARELRILGVSREIHFGVEGWTIDLISHLETTDDNPIHLKGDPRSAGFRFCATEEVAAKTANLTYYLRPDGKGNLGECRSWDPTSPKSPDSISSENRVWTALCFVLGDERYTVLHMDHPSIPKPTHYYEDTLGCFGSSFSAKVLKGNHLGVACRWWVQKGEMTIEQCAKIQQGYVPEFNKRLSKDYSGMIVLSPSK